MSPRKPPITSGVAIGRSIAPSSAPLDAAQPERPDIRRRLRRTGGAREDLLERGGQRRGAERQVQLGARTAADGAAAGAPRRLNHLVDRRDAGDRLLARTRRGVGDGADQPAVDVDRAAAHAGDDAGVRQRPALEPRQHQVAAAAPYVLEHAEDLDLELFDRRALENRAADAGHAGLDFRHRHHRRDGSEWDQRARRQQQGAARYVRSAWATASSSRTTWCGGWL